MERKELKKLLLDSTEGLLETATDLALYFIFYQVEVIGSPNMNTAVNWAPQMAQRQLNEINYKVMKRAVSQLINRGLIKKENGKTKMTPEGIERLQKILPSIGISENRKKGEVYLIAYDVNETTRFGRQHLHRLLKRIKAIRLQDSLFIIISDPQKHIENLLENIELSGQILVTKLGKESMLGGKSITDFLISAYNLNQLNDDYATFIKKFSSLGSKKISNIALDFSFNSIIKNDPNLPQEFLPENWEGDKALKLYNKLHTCESIASVVCKK